MSFLLGIDHNMDGTTRFTYDDGPTRRIQVLAMTTMYQEVLNVPADQLLMPTLTQIRPPANRRNRR